MTDTLSLDDTNIQVNRIRFEQFILRTRSSSSWCHFPKNCVLQSVTKFMNHALWMILGVSLFEFALTSSCCFVHFFWKLWNRVIQLLIKLISNYSFNSVLLCLIQLFIRNVQLLLWTTIEVMWLFVCQILARLHVVDIIIFNSCFVISPRKRNSKTGRGIHYWISRSWQCKVISYQVSRCLDFMGSSHWEQINSMLSNAF